MRAFSASCEKLRAFRRAAMCLTCLLLLASAGRADDSPAPAVARREVPRITVDDVSGEWSLTMPAGFKYTVTLTPESATSVRLTGANNFNGQYQVHFNRLVMKKPVDERLTEFKWLVHKDAGIIVLIEEPDAGKTGAQYTGAILTNRKKIVFPAVENAPPAGATAETEVSEPQVAATASSLPATPAKDAKQSWGTVRGQVVVDGEISPVKYLVRKGDPIYEARSLNDQIARVPRRQIGTHEEDVVDTSVLIDEKTRGLANVFVYVRKRPTAVHPSADRVPEKPLEFERTKWHFEPRALFAQTNQPIRVSTNVPDMVFNVHTSPSRLTAMNFAAGGNHLPEVVVHFDKPDTIPMRVIDDIGAYARASWLVLDHPYAAITSADGTFEIRDLPPGEHELGIWHERAGMIVSRHKAVVRPNEVTQLVPIHVAPEKLKRNDG
ncbi:MAG: hypothetical protein WD648_04575 [Planctomycetaceae bacterium]